MVPKTKQSVAYGCGKAPRGQSAEAKIRFPFASKRTVVYMQERSATAAATSGFDRALVRQGCCSPLHSTVCLLNVISLVLCCCARQKCRDQHVCALPAPWFCQLLCVEKKPVRRLCTCPLFLKNRAQDAGIGMYPIGNLPARQETGDSRDKTNDEIRKLKFRTSNIQVLEI